MKFGQWITADESRAAGWYNSPLTIGPEPKPTRTGATLHSLAITFGVLKFYKLFARCYGGREDEDISLHRHENCATDQKFVNLYDMMLDPFKDKGHCVTCDSAYMSNIMAQIACDVWKINMVGTIQGTFI